MPPTQNFKFKVGDAVYVPWTTKRRVECKRGVVIEVSDVEDNEHHGMFRSDLSKIDREYSHACGTRYSYVIDMFDPKYKDLSHFNVSDWKRCKGMRNAKLCDKCKDRFQCWTSRRVDR